MAVFEANFRAALNDINVQGAAHLGSLELLTRNVTADGLSVVRQGDGDELRALFMAWRGQNPRRGLHFLATYLQLTWPNAWLIEPLWQDKSIEYPKGLVVESVALADQANYFKTSRIAVSLELDDAQSSDELYRLVPVLHTALAARLMIDPKKLKRITQDIGIANAKTAQQFAYFEGDYKPQVEQYDTEMAIANAKSQQQFAYFEGDYKPTDAREQPINTANGQSVHRFVSFSGELIVPQDFKDKP
jgi:hypothetical protein